MKRVLSVVLLLNAFALSWAGPINVYDDVFLYQIFTGEHSEHPKHAVLYTKNITTHYTDDALFQEQQEQIVLNNLHIPATIEYRGEEIPVTAIGKYAFRYCTNITGTLSLPATIDTINTSAFEGCTGLTGTLDIPGSVQLIGAKAFCGCTGFTQLKINDGVKTIDNGAFFFTQDVTGGFVGDLILPNSVQTIGGQAFIWAFYKGRYGKFGRLKLPDNLQTLGGSAFYGCWGFNGDLVVPGSLKKVEAYAFRACTNLANIFIEEGVEAIEYHAFSSCGIKNRRADGTLGMDTLRLPSTLQHIGTMEQNDAKKTAFFEDAIAFVDIYAATPPAMLPIQQFSPHTIANATFKIPCKALLDYRAASGWKDIPEEHFLLEQEELVDTLAKVTVTPKQAAQSSIEWECARRTYIIHLDADPAWKFVGWYSNGVELTVDTPLTQILTTPTEFEARFIPEVSDAWKWLSDGLYVETESRPLNLPTHNAGAGIYRYQGTETASLTTRAGETLALSLPLTDGRNMNISLPIPVIITGSAHLPANADRNTEAVVLAGAELQISNAAQLRKLQVYEGGTLNVSAPLHVDTLILWGNATTGEHAQAYGIDNITAETVYYDCFLDKKRYYSLTLPGDAAPDDIKHAHGEDVAIGVKYYNGETRASGVSGWTKLTSFDGFTFKQGTGYAVFATPRTWNSTRQNLARVRFLLTDWKAATKTIAVEAYSANKPVNANWNLVGNPWPADLNGLTAPTIIRFGYWEKNEEDGTYQLIEDNQRYVVQSADNYKTYTHTPASSALLPAFSSFFVQTIGSGTLSFGAPARERSVVAAPRKAQDYTAEDELMAGIMLEANGTTDKAGFLIGEAFTNGYDFNADLAKLLSGQETLCLYSLLDDKTPLAFYATTPEQAAQHIPLGFRTTNTAGTFCFRYDPVYDIYGIEALWLTDSETGQTVNLLYNDYTFTSAVRQNDNRFTLSVVRRKITGTATTDAATLHAFACCENGTLLVARIPDNTDIYIYDTTGRLVRCAKNCAEAMRFHLPAGNYLVRLHTTDGSRLLRTIVK